ncbi:unnamed protein product [Arctogadus glacialis]
MSHLKNLRLLERISCWSCQPTDNFKEHVFKDVSKHLSKMFQGEGKGSFYIIPLGSQDPDPAKEKQDPGNSNIQRSHGN